MILAKTVRSEKMCLKMSRKAKLVIESNSNKHYKVSLRWLELAEKKLAKDGAYPCHIEAITRIKKEYIKRHLILENPLWGES